MIILGSTGSIGQNALLVAKEFNIKVDSLVAGNNIKLLNKQIEEFKPKNIYVKKVSADLKPNGAKVYSGENGIKDLILDSKSEFVLNALVGFLGLEPSLVTQQCNKKLALANKESLVSGGWLLDTNKITPIDSEHFGLWYLQNQRVISKLFITASGGAFRDFKLESIFEQTKESALKHPNWKMGNKITIDSASMVNKLFEVLEAFWLFRIKNIDAFIERSSSVHALIEFKDSSITAHFASPDMRLPISYAINKKMALNTSFIKPLSLENLEHLKFEKIEISRYPLWEYKDFLLEKPIMGIVLNAANEVCVEAFLNDKIKFGEIAKIVSKILESNDISALNDYKEIKDFDYLIREKTKEKLTKIYLP